MITAFWGTRHGQGVTSTLVHAAVALQAQGQNVRVVDLDPDHADLALWASEKTRTDYVTLDTLAEDAEIEERVGWPGWAPWAHRIEAFLGSADRALPLAVTREAAERVWATIAERDEDGSTILVDAGSGLRDYLTVRVLAEAPRLVVVTKGDLPDIVATRNALRFVEGRLGAQERVLAVVGVTPAAEEAAREMKGFHLVPIPEIPTVRAARSGGTLLQAGGRPGPVHQYMDTVLSTVMAGEPQQVATKGRRRLWRR